MVTLEAQQKILDSISNYAKSTLSDDRFAAQSDKINHLSQQLGNIFGVQSSYDVNDKRLAHEIKASNTAAFEMSVFNSIMLKDIFREGLDDIFNNSSSPLIADMTPTERKKSYTQLKNLVNEQFSVKPKTNGAKIFAKNLEIEYEKNVKHKGGGGIRALCVQTLQQVFWSRLKT